MSEEIIKEYKKFCEELKNLSFRNNFFENKNICVGRLSKSIKVFTTRYLQIVTILELKRICHQITFH